LERRQESLATRLKAGDRMAAVELVDIYYERIYLFLRRLGHSRQVSEDLTQESFLQAWRHIGQLRDGAALNSWFYRIAANASKHYWRSHKGKETAGIEGFEGTGGSEGSDDKAAKLEEIDRLEEAVAKLPIKLRQVVVLHYLEQLTIAEAAESAGVKEGTFKSRLNRALKALKNDMGS